MGAALAVGFLGLALFAFVVAGAILLAGRMWNRPWSSLLLVGLVALLAYAPLVLSRGSPHANHPTGVGVRLAFVWMAELQVLYGIPLLVFPFAVARWVFRLFGRGRAGAAARRPMTV